MFFVMQGNKVHLCHYKIEYYVQDILYVKYCISKEEADILANQYNGTIIELNTEDYEWINGITVLETSTQPKTDAEKLIALGKEGYEQYLKDQEKQKPENLVKQDDSLNKQVTDSQIALAELYEMVLASQTV